MWKWELNSQEVRGFVFILMKKLLEVDRISWTNVIFSPKLFFSFTGTEYKKGQQSFTNFRSLWQSTKKYNRVSLILDLFFSFTGTEYKKGQ